MQERSKAACRARCVRLRSQLSAAERVAAAAVLVEQVNAVLAVLPPGPVAAYASVGTEPDTSALLAALVGGPRAVLLPLLLPDGDLDWARHDGELRAGPRRLLQPTGTPLGPGTVADCALVVVPALAVDRSGTRLGRGGGSYDRALARATGPVVAALHRGELVDRLPADPHDRPVHGVVLPGAGLVRLRPHPAWSSAGGPGGMAP
jgi:5-formyltetrahydrofolate cyclo-ligase